MSHAVEVGDNESPWRRGNSRGRNVGNSISTILHPAIRADIDGYRGLADDVEFVLSVNAPAVIAGDVSTMRSLGVGIIIRGKFQSSEPRNLDSTEKYADLPEGAYYMLIF
ncbi:hypothetical protein RUND412_006521 [Rhizina undulata]